MCSLTRVSSLMTAGELRTCPQEEARSPGDVAVSEGKAAVEAAVELGDTAPVAREVEAAVALEGVAGLVQAGLPTRPVLASSPTSGSF